MREDLREILAEAEVPLIPGMLTDLGRVIDADDDHAIVATPDGVRTVPLLDPIPNIEDLSTWLICIALLASRTGLAPGAGALWYLNHDGDPAWVLEGTDEVRTRPADTEDPLLALARGLHETASEDA